MQRFVVAFLLITGFLGTYSQSVLKGVVVDSKTRIPLEFCDVSDSERLSFTNSKGMFEILTKNSFLNFSLLGYDDKTLKIAENFSDTVALDSYAFQLDEVVITGDYDPFNEIKKHIESNYPFEPTTNTYHIRATGRKENELIKFVDLVVALTAQSIFSTSDNPRQKDNLSAEIYAIRKAKTELEDTGLELFSLNQLYNNLTAIFIKKDILQYDQLVSKSDSTSKLVFKVDSTLSDLEFSGHYLVNDSDHSIMECVLVTPQKKAEYLQKGDFKYQTRDVRLFIQFKKNNKTSKYNINKALFNARIEIIPEKKDPFNFHVGYSFNLVDTIKNNDYELKKVSVNRDLFNINKNS